MNQTSRTVSRSSSSSSLFALRFPHIILSSIYTSLSRAVWIKYIYIFFIFFLNQSNVKKVHDRLYYLENGGRSVCGTAACWTATTSIARKKKESSLPLQTLASLPLNMLYTLGLLRAITTFRENRPILDRVIDDGSEERSLSSRRENQRKSVSNDWFSLLMIYFILRLARNESINFIRPLITFSCPESRKVATHARSNQR